MTRLKGFGRVALCSCDAHFGDSVMLSPAEVTGKLPFRTPLANARLRGMTVVENAPVVATLYFASIAINRLFSDSASVG